MQVSPRRVGLAVFTVLLYVAASSLLLSTPPRITQAVFWLPTGVAVAALWFFGIEQAWIVALGTILQRLLSGSTLPVALLPALGNSIEAILAVLILRRFGFRPALARLRDVLILLVAAALAPLISVLFGELSHLLASPHTPSTAGEAGWWRMNALGILMVAPVAFTWSSTPARRPSLRAVLEGCVVALVLVGLTWSLITQPVTSALRFDLAYLGLPIVLYVAVRFGPAGASLAGTAAVLVLALATVHGYGPFLGVEMASRHLVLQAFGFGLIGVPLVFGGLLGERETALTAHMQSETLRNAFQQILPDITCRIAADGTYLDAYIPPGAIVTVPREQLIGRNVRDIVPQLGDEMQARIDDTLAGKPTEPIEYEMFAAGRRRIREARYVRLASDEVLGLVRDITDRKRTEAMLGWQAEVLELVATGRPTVEVLESLVRGIEHQAPGALCSVLLLQGTRLHVAMAPSLPAEYNAAVEGVEIGPNAGSCGTAAYAGRTVIVPDIARDTLWEEFRAAALPHGLRACWSVPIRGAGGQVLGTFAVYHREPRQPEASELSLVNRAAALAGIALERQRREDLLESINRNVNEGLYRSTPDNGLVYVNAAFARMFGYASPEALLGVPSPMLFVQPARREDLRQMIAERGFFANEEVQFLRKDGTSFWALASSIGVRGEDGGIQYYDGAIADITDRKRLEEQLRQALKMEAVGKLAGGVAHDFNNLLTAISGYAEALLESLPPVGQEREDAQEIARAAERAAGLTRQLLAYSRQQVLAPRVLDVAEVVDQLGGMLRRLIGEHIRLVVQHGSAETFVRVDRGQLEQVLLNLALNARDAMPGGGILTISTSAVVLDDVYSLRYLEARPGPHVCLTVADTGAGMTAEIQRRAFDPFFTTKEQGKGTGLGLSTVYGIVRQSEGSINLESTPGAGTTVRVYLPLVSAPPEESAAVVVAEPTGPGTGRVLVVEDEALVRELVCRTLLRAGYSVLVAENGEAALVVSGAGAEGIDLVVTDVIMPRMGGRELAERLRQIRPGLPILFVSGYTNEAIVESGALGVRMEYLQKPFTPSVLLDRVRHLLASEPVRG